MDQQFLVVKLLQSFCRYLTNQKDFLTSKDLNSTILDGKHKEVMQDMNNFITSHLENTKRLSTTRKILKAKMKNLKQKQQRNLKRKSIYENAGSSSEEGEIKQKKIRIFRPRKQTVKHVINVLSSETKSVEKESFTNQGSLTTPGNKENFADDSSFIHHEKLVKTEKTLDTKQESMLETHADVYKHIEVVVAHDDEGGDFLQSKDSLENLSRGGHATANLVDEVEQYIENIANYKSEVQHGPNKFYCKFCQYFFSQFRSLKNHLHDVHSSKRPFSCDICKMAFKRKSHMQDHRETHDGKHYECELCEQRFARKRYLQEHIQRHKQMKMFTCNICMSAFSNRNIYNAHMLKHEYKDKEEYFCDICGSSFLDIKTFNQHIGFHAEG